jgi:alkanesulfonate monooxygenase SsuD/methylene tetrahydromethanopterin reductase-like flavin-dependent oxidoreductase (luciferase family)
MINSRRLSFGIKTSQANTTYREILDIWREADENPLFEHAWLWDHLVPIRGEVTGPALEAWTLLAALAAQTKRLRLGVVVTSNRIRPPAVLAKMAATVDQISGGRLVFGIGAGGFAVADPAGLALVHREFDAYGIPVVPAAEAVEALAEACVIFRRMWTEDEPFDFTGRHYSLKGAICEPKPLQRPHPPMLIAAAGERVSLRIVAENADMWVCPARDAQELRQKSEVLDRHCVEVGRDPAEIARVVQLILRPGDQADPGRVLDNVLEFVDAGASQFILAAVGTPGSPVGWLAENIVEPVLGRVPAA